VSYRRRGTREVYGDHVDRHAILRLVAAETSQTLDRGLRLLNMIAESRDGLSVADAAAALGVGRAVAYRLITTLTGHSYVRRDDDGRLRLGSAVLRLAAHATPLFATLASPELRRLAEAVGATAHLTIAEDGEARALAVIEPTWTSVHVAYRVGTRHPLDRGAAGLAILSGRRGDPEWVVTSGALQEGAWGVAAPVLGVPGLEASVGVVALSPLDDTVIGARVVVVAQTVADLLKAEK
jgi:DNA-binding IclR family transcriptional regulator